MFGGGSGSTVGANVVLTADNSQYNQSMQQSAQQTNQLAESYDSLKQKIGNGLTTAKHVAIGVTAADVATLGAATVAAGRFQDQIRGLVAQNNVLSQSFGNGNQRMKDYTSAVNELRSNFGTATQSAVQLVQTISGFERNGSTQGLTQLANTFEKMSQTTREDASALAQSVLTLGQTMGNTLSTAKAYSDQLTTMADSSNTTAESLANFAAQIGPLGRQLNMTQSQVTGFAAAFSKAGQDGYRAANVFSQMTSQIAQAVQTNSPVLQQYANLLGVSVDAFKSMQGANQVAGVFDAIGRQGSNSLQTLNALGFDGLTTIRTISAVTQQSGGVQNMIRQANAAYGDNASAAGKQTTSQQFAKFGQDLSQMGQSIGKPFMTALGGIMSFVDKMAQGVTAFMNGPGGKLVDVIATLVGSFAALAAAVLSATHILGPLITVLTIRKFAASQGFMEGLRGGGSIQNLGSDTEVAGLGPRATAIQASGRRATSGFFNFGQRVGASARKAGAGNLVKDFAYDEEGNFLNTYDDGTPIQRSRLSRFFMPFRGVRQSISPFARGAARVGIGAAKLGWDVAGRSTVEGVTKNPEERHSLIPDLFSNRFKGGSNVSDTAESNVASEAQTLGQRFSTLGQTVAMWGQSLAASITGNKAQRDSSDEQAAAEKTAADETSGFGATIKSMATKVSDSFSNLIKSLTSATTATEDMAKAEASAATSMATSAGGMAGMRGATGEAGAAEEAAGGGLLGGLGGLLGGAFDLATGPIGLAAMIGIPLVMGMFNKGNTSAPSSAVAGTGLSFAAPGVVDPNARATSAFNPNKPSGVDYYNASLNSDFQNPGVQNIATATQAAALYGPIWNQLPLAQQQSLAMDLMNSRSLGGGYNQFLTLMQSGRYRNWSPSSVSAMSGVTGGLSNLYNLQAQSNFSNLLNPANANLQAAAMDFLGGNLHGWNANWDRGLLQGGGHAIDSSSGGLSGLGWGNFSSGNDLVKYHHVGGFMGVGGHMTNTLQAQGIALSQALGLGRSGGENDDLGNVLGKMPTSVSRAGATAQMNYILSHLHNADLQRVLGNAGDSNISTSYSANLAEALKDFNAHSSQQLTSAFKGFSKDVQKNAATIDAQNQNNPLYGAHLLSGASQKQLAGLYTSGVDQSTVLAAMQYKNQMLSLKQPYMSTSEYLFGTNPGSGSVRSNPDNLLSQYRGALNIQKKEVASGQWAGDSQGQQLLDSTYQNLSQNLTSAVESIKSYNMSMQQLNFSTQQFNESLQWQNQQESLNVGREKTQEGITVAREDYQYNLQRSRSEHDFNLQRTRAEYDYNLQRSRALQDFSHQTQLMVKQSAETMMNIYQQNPTQSLTSAQFLLYNNANQTNQLMQQESQLDHLRNMGLSTNSIQQLGLGDANNNQELNSLFQQIQQNPALIDQLNTAVQQRLTAAGALATDASSQTYQEQTYQFHLSLNRSSQDFTTSMSRSLTDFHTQLARSKQDFDTTMKNQSEDFNRQMQYQATDFATQMLHSQTQFDQSMNEQVTQMKEAEAPLGNISNYLTQAAKQHGPMGQLARALEQAAQSSPAIAKMLGMFTSAAKSTSKPAKNSTLNALEQVLMLGSAKAPTGFMSIFGGGLGGGIAVDKVTGSSLASSRTDIAGVPSGVYMNMAASNPTIGMCLSDVETVWGAQHGFPTALSAWLGSAGHRHSMGGPMPPGVPIYFGAPYGLQKDGTYAGHVALNAGGGMMWSQDTGKWRLEKIWPGALGWADEINGTPTAINPPKGYAHGSWNLPEDQIAQIHKGEMIIPAKIASVVRQAVSSSDVRNLSTYAHPVVAHHDNRSYSTTTSTNFTGDVTVVAQNPAEMANQLKQQARLKALAR